MLPLDAVEVQPPAGGVDHEGDLVPLVVGIAGGGHRTAAAVVDAVGGVAVERGAEVAAVEIDGIAVAHAGHGLGHDAADPCRRPRLEPGGDGDRVGIEIVGGGDLDVIVDAVEGDGLAEASGRPHGPVDEHAGTGEAGALAGGGGAALVEAPVAGEADVDGGGGVDGEAEGAGDAAAGPGRADRDLRGDGRGDVGGGDGGHQLGAAHEGR